MTMKATILMHTGCLAFALAGCATTLPPRELIAARASYSQARQGDAARFDPADLHTAQKAMESAERSFDKDGDTGETRDLAYVADRRAQLAEARGAATRSAQEEQAAIAKMHAVEGEQLRTTSSQLGSARQALAVQGQSLAAERTAREASDKRATQAAADLAQYASVKQETRGMVITVSGGVLFASGKADLLPAARVGLNNVAEALSQQDPESNILVEGHTDAQGGAALNQELSERRAKVVRDYLVTRGLASDRISSEGFGSSRSVADNSSAEGRANNRRVEIVVEPTRVASAPR
jgi:outer membrane protein OmpA-like peptidoglycan-associated protein